MTDPGCWSGDSKDCLANLKSGSETLAIDFSSFSINITTEKLVRSFGDKLVNLTVQNLISFEVVCGKNMILLSL